MSDLGIAISPASFWVPDYLCQTAWTEHAPFAFWLCDAVRPRRFIELGTHYGYSYFAICQAIDRLGLGTAAYAVDTWQGDEHAGFYDESVFQSVALRNGEKYSAFSTLLRSTFDEALGYFADKSVDLLHIDGRHLHEDVAHDFATWRPKLTDNAVVLFHDTNVRERGFGVWGFFAELASQLPSFQFFHGHGLGVLVPGGQVPPGLSPLFAALPETADRVRAAYGALGAALSLRREISGLRSAVVDRDRKIAALGAALSDAERRTAVPRPDPFGATRSVRPAPAAGACEWRPRNSQRLPGLLIGAICRSAARGPYARAHCASARWKP